MRSIFHCSYCKKIVEKKIIKKGNTYYLPVRVTHKHKKMEFLLEQIIPHQIKGY